MAIHTEHETAKIYAVATRFRDHCLLRDESLLADAPVWTLANLQRLHQVFVAAPDEGERTFLVKFKDQILPAGTEVIRLAAEVLCVYFLFPSNVGGGRKREVINEVLGWAGENLPTDSLVSQAFANGIGSGGYGYNTRRPFEIGFLIELAIAWKKQTAQEQSERINDGAKFQEIVDSIEDAEGKQLRHMLLYLLFPEVFERIASSGHKRRIVKAFGALLTGKDPQNEDQAILMIRQKLEALLPGRDLDFYWPPLVGAWFDDSDDSEDESPIELIQHKKQIVLYGPPGTGKTFSAKRLAGRIIRAHALQQMGPARYFQSQDAIADTIATNVHRLQLHPAYSYEDFIRALHIAPGGATEYRTGYLPRLIDAMEQTPRDQRLPHVLILDEMNRTDLSRMLGECFSLLEDRKEAVDLPARDGDGNTVKLSIPDDLYIIGTMNLIDQSIEQIDFALRRRFLWIACPFSAEHLLSAAAHTWTSHKSPVTWDRVESDFSKLAAAATALNREVRNSKWLGPQYEIGHTYFLDVVTFLRSFLGDLESRKQNYLWNRKGQALEPVKRVWTLSIRPLLEQYLSGLNAIERTAELERLSNVMLKVAVKA